ncbi:MAG: hypothetical protein WD010_00450, partial [Nitriliruptor sp.]
DDDLRATIRGLAVEEEPVPIDADTAAWRVRTLVALRVEAETKRLRERLQTLHRLFLDFDPDAITTPNIWGYLWGKLAYGAMLFGTALTDLSIADALAHARHRAL